MTGARRGLAGEHTRARRTPIVSAWVLALLAHVLALWLLDALVDGRRAERQREPLDIVLVRASPPLPAAPPDPGPEPVREPPPVPEPEPEPEPEPQPPPTPEPASASTAPLASEPVPAAPAPEPVVATPQAPAATTPPALRRIVLFETDGRLRVPEGVLDGDPEPAASYIPVPRDAPPWEQKIDPLVYEPTAFEAIWKPDQESLMGEFFRRSTVTKTFKTPWGTKVTCSWVLIVGGCGW